MSNPDQIEAGSGGQSPSPPATAANVLRIFIADDHELLRAGVRRLIETHECWEVCGEAAEGTHVAEAVRKLAADVVILDLALPGVRGLDAAKQIKSTSPGAEILIFSGDDAPASIHAAFQAGASSYIRKGDDHTHLVAAIESLAVHKPYLTPDVSKVLLGAFFSGSTAKTESLSDREREVVRLLCEGKNNQQVATLLSISSRTVEVHRATIMRKLEIETFAELVRYAVRHNLVDP
jgi:DNA-binding NarL/FixJ family response regulator